MREVPEVVGQEKKKVSPLPTLTSHYLVVKLLARRKGGHETNGVKGQGRETRALRALSVR